VNGVFTARDRDDRVACALEARGREALAEMPDALATLPRTDVPLYPFALIGADGFRRVLTGATSGSAATGVHSFVHPDPLITLIDDLERAGRGVIFTMGKGGVGKTTTAAAIAVELAARGHEVLLSTTDPAAHVAEAIGGAVPHLRVTRIDPVAETRAYSDEVISAAAPTLDARGRDLLEEDLRSPCTEEIAVFRAFAQAVAQGEDGFVILDTAPTGHTLLLLDAAEAYHREVSRTQGAAPKSVRQLLPRLRDPEFTRVLLVTLPEATPVHEAAQLQDDLRRAGIEPFAWVVNQSFADASISDPVLRERGAREQPYLTEVREQLAHRVAWVPWYPEPPVGRTHLLEFVRGGTVPALAPMAS
jgi:arsenite-transporting ATPase